MVTKEKIKRLSDRVEFVLQNYPQTRDCDVELTRMVWKKFYNVVDDFISRQEMKLLPREDGIKRIRAKFNSKGHYYPKDLAVVKRRKLNEEVYYNYYA